MWRPAEHCFVGTRGLLLFCSDQGNGDQQLQSSWIEFCQFFQCSAAIPDSAGLRWENQLSLLQKCFFPWNLSAKMMPMNIDSGLCNLTAWKSRWSFAFVVLFKRPFVTLHLPLLLHWIYLLQALAATFLQRSQTSKSHSQLYFCNCNR